MLTEQQTNKIIYYSASVLAAAILTVIYLVTGNEDWGYAIIALVSTVFGIPLMLNEIPHWIKDLRAPSVATAESEGWAKVLDRVVKVDEQLMKQTEEQTTHEIPGDIVQTKEATAEDLAFLFKAKE